MSDVSLQAMASDAKRGLCNMMSESISRTTKRVSLSVHHVKKAEKIESRKFYTKSKIFKSKTGPSRYDLKDVSVCHSVF